MAHEILSVKLCELEEELSRLSSRIHLSETAGHAQLQREIQTLRQECAEMELTMQTKLRLSRAKIVTVLADSYGEVEQSIRKAGAALGEQVSGCGGQETAAERKILLAEYALDFALQAANRALLLAMEAIDAQFIMQEGDKKTS